MTDLITNSNSTIHETSSTNGQIKRFSYKNFSYFGLFTCLATLVLAFLFKDYLIYFLSYLDSKSSSNIIEFHLILIILFICVSLPILWGYVICVLICSFVYSFLVGFFLVSFYSAIGMSCSFFICRYMFYDCAHQRVVSISYLLAITHLIESKEKGTRIIFLSRLMPIPFGLANALFSVTDINFRKYVFASVIGLMPTQLITCYMGSTLKSMSDVLSNENTAKTASLVFIVQLLIAVAVMYYILNAAKNELNKHLDEKNKSILINHSQSDENLKKICQYCENKDFNKLNLDCERCKLLMCNQNDII